MLWLRQSKTDIYGKLYQVRPVQKTRHIAQIIITLQIIVVSNAQLQVYTASNGQS